MVSVIESYGNNFSWRAGGKKSDFSQGMFIFSDFIFLENITFNLKNSVILKESITNLAVFAFKSKKFYDSPFMSLRALAKQSRLRLS